jgi:hypothetical protein
LNQPVFADQQLYVFARADDYFFGVLHGRLHEVWARVMGTQLREKESGNRYTPTTCFETFPFPRATAAQEPTIAAAAKELNELRERWLNPAEWTETRTLEFPGSADGPWARYVDAKTVDAKTGIRTVRYPRLEPRDDDCAAKLKKRTLTNLYNERPAWLDLAHQKLDAAVAAAYGWSDLTDILERSGSGEIYDFKTGHYVQVDCTPEGFDAIIRQLEKEVNEEILKRLLALNQQRAAEEKSAPRKSRRTSRDKSEEEFV